VPLNTCHPTSRASRATPCSGLRVAEPALAVYRRIIPTLYVPCHRFVLDRYLPRSVLVAYIFPLARPRPGIEIQSLFPSLCLCVSAASRLKFHALYEFATVPLEPRGPNTDCIATSRLAFPLSLSHTHTHSLSLSLSLSHTHSLSLSLSLSAAAGITTLAHRPSSDLARVLISGTSLGYLYSIPFRTRARTLPPPFSGNLQVILLTSPSFPFVSPRKELARGPGAVRVTVPMCASTAVAGLCHVDVVPVIGAHNI
jgi:hypothetical protein